jgi:hypothetical protein
MGLMEGVYNHCDLSTARGWIFLLRWYNEIMRKSNSMRGGERK